MKKKAYLIFLILGLIVLAVGVFFFGRICAVKDSIYAKYGLSFSDASIESVFINDHDEAAVKASLLNRDKIDSSRKTAPLKVADGAVVIDSTELTIDEVLAAILDNLPADYAGRN